MMTRHDLWPSRLAACIASARERPYRLGEWDCPTFVAACIEAMTGVDVRSHFRGHYHDIASARAWMRAFSRGGQLAEAASIVAARIGAPLIPVKLAGRGDVVLIDLRDAAGLAEGGPGHMDGDEALGVVDLDGRRALFPAPRGFTALPLRLCKLAWRI